MRPNQKKSLLDDLIIVKRRLVWGTQSRFEQLQSYSTRIQRTYELYIRAGEVASNEIIDVTETKLERERLAIFGYVSGLHHEIKRYTCKPEFYSYFAQARRHAEQIAYHLDDLANMATVVVYNHND